MSQTVAIRRLHSWAILPTKRHVDRTAPREMAELLETQFRHHRQFRYPEACPPWVLGQELGWVVASPITITMTPLDDVQVAAPDQTELRTVGRVVGRDELWRRGAGYIATTRSDWLRAHQFRGTDNGWEGMFVPNGHGSVEWRMGWSIRIPDGHFLLVTGLDGHTGMTVPTGVLTDRQTNRTWDTDGFSMAVRPEQAVTLERGQPIARLVLLGRDSLQAKLMEPTP